MKAYTAIFQIERGVNADPSVVKPGELYQFTGDEKDHLLANGAIREATDDELALARGKNGGRLSKSAVYDVSELDADPDDTAAADALAKAEEEAAKKLAEADKAAAAKIADAEKRAAEIIAEAEKAAAANKVPVEPSKEEPEQKSTGKPKKAKAGEDPDLDV